MPHPKLTSNNLAAPRHPEFEITHQLRGDKRQRSAPRLGGRRVRPRHLLTADIGARLFQPPDGVPGHRCVTLPQEHRAEDRATGSIHCG